MDIRLEKLQDRDAKNLYKFELENREFFEKMVPSRGDDYYKFETFKTRHQALLDEQAQGISNFYLVKNKDGSILGRMNLIDINPSQQLGHLGYRIGKKYVGAGIASSALKLLLANAEEMGITKIFAKTTENNIASQKVMEKNGFAFMETRDEEFEMNGPIVKFLYYNWTIT